MVSIAAVTSLISILECATQIVAQIFKFKNIKVLIIVSSIGLIASIPIGISLGHSLNGDTLLSLGDKNLLKILDSIVNLVLIPIGALAICLSIGFFMYKNSERKDIFSSAYLAKRLEEDGLKFGKFGPIFAFMIKFIVPIAVLAIEVVGLIDEVWVLNDKGGRTFSLDGLIVVLIAFGVVAIAMAIYFIFLKNRDTGENEIETSEIEEVENK